MHRYPAMNQQPPGVDELWIQHQRRNAKTTQSWACIHCPDRHIFVNSDELWAHALREHHDRIPSDEGEQRRYRTKFEAESAEKKCITTKYDWQPQKPTFNNGINGQPDPPPLGPHGKRPLSSAQPTRSLAGLGQLEIGGTPHGSDVAMQDVSEDNQTPGQPRKRAAIGDGISAGSAPPFRDCSASPPPRRTKSSPQPTRKLAGLGQLNIGGTPYRNDVGMQCVSENNQAHDQPRKRVAISDSISAVCGAPFSESSASPPLKILTLDGGGLQAISTLIILDKLLTTIAKKNEAPHKKSPSRKSKAQASRPASTPGPFRGETDICSPSRYDTQRSCLIGKKQLWSPDYDVPVSKILPFRQSQPWTTSDHWRFASETSRQRPYEGLYIITPPESRPISQEQWKTDVNGLAKIDTKCLQADNKHVSRESSASRSSAHASRNNEQWQAVLAFHRTLLYEHHDFFLTSQPPSASLGLQWLSALYTGRAQISNCSATHRHHMLASIYFDQATIDLLYDTGTVVQYPEPKYFEHYKTAIKYDIIHNRPLSPYTIHHLHSRWLNERLFIKNSYHHLAVSACHRGDPLCSHHTESLRVVIPFTPTWEPNINFFAPARYIMPKNTMVAHRTASLTLDKKEQDCHIKFGKYNNTLLLLDNIRYEERTSRPCRENWASPQANSPRKNDVFAPYLRVFAHQLSRKFLSLFAFFCSLRVAASLPTQPASNATSGLTKYLSYQEQKFKEQIAGPLVLNLIWASFLLVSFLIIKLLNRGWWQGRDLVRITAPSVSFSAFYLGKGDQIADWPLVFLWIFSFGLNIEFLKTELKSFPKSRGLVAFLIVSSGGVSATWIACTAKFEDRYKDPWNAGAMISLPATSCFELAWLAVIMATGFAKKLERGMYNVAFFEYMKDVIFTREVAYVDRVSNAERGIRNDRARLRRRTYSGPLPTRQRTRAS